MVTTRAVAFRNRSNFHSSLLFGLRLNTKIIQRELRTSVPNELCLLRRLTHVLALCALPAMVAGCALHKGTAQPASDSAAAQASDNPQTSDNTAPPGAEAKIHISYAHPGDFLSSLIVTKYSSATDLRMQTASKDGDASMVRFNGGAVVWQIGLTKSFLSRISVLHREQKGDELAEVKYGDLPKNFVQTIPDSGPPEPLEPDNYYIFTVTRASGSTNYEAIKVESDGVLEAYEAEPRAGTSFRLCCNLSAGFTVTSGPPSSNSPAP
jgi:hypothetical protein